MGQVITVEVSELLKEVSGPSCSILDRLDRRQLGELLDLALAGSKTFSVCEIAGARGASSLLLTRAVRHVEDWSDFVALMPIASHDECTVVVVEALVDRFCALVPSVLTRHAVGEVTRCLARIFSTGFVNESRRQRLLQTGADVAGLVVAADELWQILESRQLGQQLQNLAFAKEPTSADALADPTFSQRKIHEQLRASLQSSTGSLSKIGLVRHENCSEKALNMVVDHLCSERGGRLLSSRISLGIALRHLAACPVLQDKHIARLRKSFDLMDELWDSGIALTANRRRAAAQLLTQPSYLQPTLVTLLRSRPDLTLGEAIAILAASN